MSQTIDRLGDRWLPAGWRHCQDCRRPIRVHSNHECPYPRTEPYVYTPGWAMPGEGRRPLVQGARLRYADHNRVEE